MKTLLQKTLGRRVHGLWFIPACLLLVSLLTGAILLANQVLWAIDGTIEQVTEPIPTPLHPRPIVPPNPATSH